MFSVCKVVYTDPKSDNYKTIDGMIVNGDRSMPYAVVYDKGTFSEAQAYNCAQGVRFDQIKELMSLVSGSVKQDVSIVCVDEMTTDEVRELLRSDLRDAFETEKVLVNIVFENCFADLIVTDAL